MSAPEAEQRRQLPIHCEARHCEDAMTEGLAGSEVLEDPPHVHEYHACCVTPDVSNVRAYREGSVHSSAGFYTALANGNMHPFA